MGREKWKNAHNRKLTVTYATYMYMTWAVIQVNISEKERNPLRSWSDNPINVNISSTFFLNVTNAIICVYVY